MAYCVKCGEKVEDTAVTCPVCGAVIPKTESTRTQSGGYTYGGAETQNGGGYTYGGAETQSSGYTYGNAGTQNNEYTYGSAYSQDSGNGTYNTYDAAELREGYFPDSEVRSNKVMAVLCYIGILVFIPIIAGDRQSEYLKLHKNQGLILFIIDTLFDLIENNWGWSAGFFSRITGGALGVVCDIVQVVILILWLVGLTYACRGTKKELPGIGKIKIFK